MKICVFQGTFNPVHNAHIRLAKYVRDNFNYDKIIFIPAYKPPHKNFDESFSKNRLEMVKLAVEGIENFDVSDIEYKREGLSYTYLTILDLYRNYEIEGKIGFIIGTDAFVHISEWYEAEKLKTLIDFILFKRSATIDENKLALLSKRGYKFNMMDIEFLDISSSDIRQKIGNNEKVDGLLPQNILEYIEKNELYRK